MATARYLKQELQKAGVDGVDEVDSTSKRDRTEILQQFAPYYNASSSADLAARSLKETRILIATDVLSEGLNLQDATRLINYDIHWNPVRLMQRIGRVDRRLNPDAEKKLIADHPEEKKRRGKVLYWNFLPPDELDELLRLYSRVAHKTLRISKVFGIEGKKLLKPDDDFDALRDFLSNYEGITTPTEKMQLELERLLKEQPGLENHLDGLPGRVFQWQGSPQKRRPGHFLLLQPACAGHRISGMERCRWPHRLVSIRFHHAQNPRSTGGNSRLHPLHAGNATACRYDRRITAHCPAKN